MASSTFFFGKVVSPLVCGLFPRFDLRRDMRLDFLGDPGDPRSLTWTRFGKAATASSRSSCRGQAERMPRSSPKSAVHHGHLNR